MRAKTRFRHLGLLYVTGVALLINLLVAGLGSAIALAQSTEAEGKKLFQEKCVACHTIGGGILVGPDLKNVTSLRSRDWLMRWILEPDKMLAEGDATATQLFQEFNNVPMPNLGLSEPDAVAVLAYLETSKEGASATQSIGAQVPVLPQGNSMIGKNLFMGITRFQNGGPACMGCHSITGIGALGGGALGPDLTPAYTKFGEKGIVSILDSFPFPTMNPIFSKYPLTPEEQANLRVFLESASVTERPTQTIGKLTLLAIVGMVVLLVIAQLLWRHRLSNVRHNLLSGRKS
jgi:mono/diheme cytochrome c family protein